MIMTTGPGPRMLAIARYIAEHPGCNKSEAARCGTTKGLPPYAGSVESLIRGGYVRTEQAHSTANYRLYLTQTGRDLAQQTVNMPRAAETSALSRERARV